MWVDTFTKLPVDNKVYRQIMQMGYKMCLVSPELQGQPEKIETYVAQIAAEGIQFDAVCTKSYNIDKWKKLFMQQEGGSAQ